MTNKRTENLPYLFSVYAVERQDDQSALVVAFAITTAGITYVIAAAAYLSDHCGRTGCRLPLSMQLAAPAIPVALFGFLVLNVAATRIRSVHLQRLEATLKIGLPFGGEAPRFHTEAGMVYRPDDLTAKPRIRLVFAAVTFISYGVVATILIGFTWAALLPGPWEAAKTTTATIYAFFESIEILGFVAPLWHASFRPKNADATPGCNAGVEPGQAGPPPVRREPQATGERSSSEAAPGKRKRWPLRLLLRLSFREP